jgi:hypothetical protein
VFIRTGEVNVSWDNFLRPFSTGLWIVTATCAVVLALAFKICFKAGLAQGREQPRDEKLLGWILATFGAVFCLQGNDKLGKDMIFL